MAKRKSTKSKSQRIKEKCEWNATCTHSSGGVYFLAFVGALVYFLASANGFWMGVWGFIKAMLWPAFLVFELLKFLGA